MGINRRSFLRASIGASLALSGLARAEQVLEQAKFAILESYEVSDHSVARLIKQNGETLARIPLSMRGHGFVQRDAKLWIFGRRPRTRMARIDLDNLTQDRLITAPRNRHFYGHGAFQNDYLFTTENDLDSLQGRLGIYDVDGRRVDDFPLPGAGPHEIITLPNNKLLVCLGGLETHPDYGREPFNRATFESKVVLVDPIRNQMDILSSGGQGAGISLRHAAQKNGQALIGGQIYDAARANNSTLLWRFDGSELHPIDVGIALGGYIGSVASNGDNFLVSARNTNRALEVDLEGNIIGTRYLNQPIAVAGSGNQNLFAGPSEGVLSTGKDLAIIAEAEIDNHAIDLN